MKFFLRLMLPVFALGGFGGIWGLVLVGFNQEKIVSGIWSPDKQYRASVVLSTASGGCGRERSSFVLVERQNYFVKTGEFTPFCLDGTPDRIKLRWNDSRSLAIECSGCEQNYGYANLNWGKLRFVYDLDRP